MLSLWLVIAAVGGVIWVGAHLPPIQSLEIPKRPPSIQIVDVNLRPLAVRGDSAGAVIALKDLPPYLPKAFIAIEDRRFYSHWGVDPYGIGRAVVANVLHRGVSQGGSTLTQQLAKNLFLTQERTIHRKLQEVMLALWLERKFTKTQILELYLNRVYFGAGAYGIEQAALRYFGHSARQVTVAEAAMLAGLVKSPSRLAPNRNYEDAEDRAHIVLARDDRTQLHHVRAREGRDRQAAAHCRATRQWLDQLRRRLGDGRRQRPNRPCRRRSRRRHHHRRAAAGAQQKRRWSMCSTPRATKAASRKARWSP